jgi:hypothetical protein
MDIFDHILCMKYIVVCERSVYVLVLIRSVGNDMLNENKILFFKN